MGIKVFINDKFDKYVENVLKFNEHYTDLDLIIINSSTDSESGDKIINLHTIEYHKSYIPPEELYEYVAEIRSFERDDRVKVIDFEELPDDGIAFEQLIREMFLREGYETHWTGVGPDQGRDLIVVEKLEGPLSQYKRTWLIQCKHKAHSGNSVGIGDIDAIIDSCSAVNANGYLLTCSTQPSSALLKRFEEIENSKRLVIRYWDSIEIEKRLFKPSCFSLIHLFFPKTSEKIGWRIYNSESPSFWAANYKDCFIYLSSRVAMSFPDLRDAEKILGIIEKAPKLPKNQTFRPRAIHFDNKHEIYTVYVDYMVSKDDNSILSPSQLNQYFRDGSGLYEDNSGAWYLTYWDFRLVRVSRHSDSYHRDSKEYYESYIQDFKSGGHRDGTLSDLVFLGDSW